MSSANRTAIEVATAPSSPTAASGAPAGHGTVRVMWGPPVDDGGELVTGPRSPPHPGGKKVQVGAATHEVDVTGLDNGTPYTFTVTATYAVGTSPGASTTPISPIAGLTGPTNVTATAGDGSVTVT